MGPLSLRPFWAFLVVSVMLHLALVAELPGVPLRIDETSAPLSAEIVALEPVPAPPPPRTAQEAFPKPVAQPRETLPEPKRPTPAAAKPTAPKPAAPKTSAPKPPTPKPPKEAATVAAPPADPAPGQSEPPSVEPALPAASTPPAAMPDRPAEAQDQAAMQESLAEAQEPVDPSAAPSADPAIAAQPEAAGGPQPGQEDAAPAAGAAPLARAQPGPPASPAATAAEAPPAQTGSIQYEVFYGSDRFSIGRSVQTWSIDQETYRLTSYSETTGLLGLFKPYQYSYVAEGRVGPDGLRPEALTVRTGRDGEQQATARFDWTHKELTFGKLGSPRKAALDSSSYDLLTLFYQLPRLTLAPGRIEVSVTTGTKFRTYQLDVLPEELIELPIGTVRAIPVRQVRTPGEESIELWLAPEKRNLPVRICFFDDDGAMAVEQVATRISVGTLAADGR